ncbi:MAG: NAD(P)/FAD-dependent oxidoreductase [Gammaproteobacteria bacterium]|nr:NAD(P)/FAD-dependent oxidoreductase [Gammaproteobacteria bacterium]MDE0513567.1 NAD(P)/FAD-dependent oxidoreductase [Gammaproteobacteria bacterium]
MQPRQASTVLTRRNFLQAGSAAALSVLYRPVFAARKHYDVIVVGAGLAGLQAGRKLYQHGVDFLLLEGSERVGGRVFTFDDLPGRPEAGGTQVGTNYRALNQALTELNITTTNIRPGAPGMTLLVNGHLSSLEKWTGSPGNLLPEALKDTPPYGLLPKLLRNGSFLSGPLDWWKPEFSAMDIPLQAYLKQMGADDEAIRLVDANLNGESVGTLSALDLLRKLAVLQAAGAPQDINGGTQRLPDAMYASINTAVVTGKQVTAINAADTGIKLFTADADSYTCRLCLVALPFSVLRRLDIQAPLSPLKQQAIRHMGYTPVTHVFIKPKSPFWLADGLSPNMWTDTDLGRIFTQTDEQGEVIRLRAWIQGPAAQRVDGIPEHELGEHIVSLLEQARPVAKSKLEVERVMSWGKNPFANGAFSHYLAGGVGQFSRDVSRPEGLLHFIGAHTEPSASGMEAAVKSGVRGAQEVINRLS